MLWGARRACEPGPGEGANDEGRPDSPEHAHSSADDAGSQTSFNSALAVPDLEFSQRSRPAQSPAARQHGDAAPEDMPASWRDRDRQSRRVCRGECGECHAYVFTDQYREFHDNTYFHRECYARKAAQVLISTLTTPPLPGEEEEEEMPSGRERTVPDLVTSFEARAAERRHEHKRSDDELDMSNERSLVNGEFGEGSAHCVAATAAEDFSSARRQTPDEEDAEADKDALLRSVQQIEALHRSVQELARADRSAFDAFPAGILQGPDNVPHVVEQTHAKLQADLEAAHARSAELEQENGNLQQLLEVSERELNEERSVRESLQAELDRAKSEKVHAEEEFAIMQNEHGRILQEMQSALQERECAVESCHAARQEAERAIQFCEEAVALCDLAQQVGLTWLAKSIWRMR